MPVEIAAVRTKRTVCFQRHVSSYTLQWAKEVDLSGEEKRGSRVAETLARGVSTIIAKPSRVGRVSVCEQQLPLEAPVNVQNESLRGQLKQQIYS